MKVKVRTFNSDEPEVVVDGIAIVQAGRDGTIVWVRGETFDADILLTIECGNRIMVDGGTLWVRGPND